MKLADWKTIRLEELEGGRLVRIELASGKGNVIDTRLIGELGEALDAAGSREGLRAIVLDHAGNHFSYGASVEEHAPGVVEDVLPKLHALVRRCCTLDVPLLACVRGACLGGGLEIAGLAERIFASSDARFGMPEVKLGVFAPVGSLLLQELVGWRHAADLLLSGRTVGAEEAADMGLVSEISPHPCKAAVAWARAHLLSLSPSSLRFATHAARYGRNRRLLGALDEVEKLYLEELMATHDAREGVAAFLEKREPSWESA